LHENAQEPKEINIVSYYRSTKCFEAK